MVGKDIEQLKEHESYLKAKCLTKSIYVKVGKILVFCNTHFNFVTFEIEKIIMLEKIISLIYVCVCVCVCVFTHTHTH